VRHTIIQTIRIMW